MTKLEEIARALFMRDVDRDVVDDTTEEWAALRGDFLEEARLAVEAMMSPSEAMMEAGREVNRLSPGKSLGLKYGPFLASYEAMLRAILDEAPETQEAAGHDGQRDE